MANHDWYRRALEAERERVNAIAQLEYEQANRRKEDAKLAHERDDFIKELETANTGMRSALEAIQDEHEELTVYEWDYDSGDFKLNSAGERIIVARLCQGCTPESIKEEIEDASYDAAGSYNDVHFPCATRRLADQGLGDNLARTTKNGENNE